ncbi:MAG: hypothetical protein LBE25_13450 [Arthrobacter sp.]|jgi:hypothetical protein|nr:hypothetical protein [Arthrobacter sp.]
MAADYASLSDLQSHWPGLPGGREDEAKQKLHEASVEIRALYPDVDTRVLNGDLDADVPRLVACRMVKRSMDTPDIPGGSGAVTQVSQTAGPMSTSYSFANTDGALFLSGADKRLLRTSRAGRTAFMIRPGAHAVGH